MLTSILFVCTGNTCRSVMAEYLLKQHAEQANLKLEIGSAGVGAFTGDVAAENAVSVLAELGIDASGHRSRKADYRLLAEYDLILAMTQGHKQRLLELAPDLTERIFLLKEFAFQLSGQEAEAMIENRYEILDPFGQSLEVYRNSREEISEAVQSLIHYGNIGEMKA